MFTTHNTTVPATTSEPDPASVLAELLQAVSAPLTVLMLTVERLAPGAALNEEDYRLLLQNLDHINKAVKWCKQQE